MADLPIPSEISVLQDIDSNLNLSAVHSNNLSQILGSPISPTNGMPIYDAYIAPQSVTWDSTTLANAALTLNTSGMDTVVLSFIPSGSITGGIISFEVFDGVNWIAIRAPRIESYSTDLTVSLTGATTHGWQVPVAGFPSFRVRLSTALVGTGSLLLTGIVSSAPDTSLVTVGIDPLAPIPAGSNLIGYVGMGANTMVADFVSAAVTTTTTTAQITPFGGSDYEFNFIVSAVTGTNPTCDVVVQESDDNGTNWFDVYHFPRITATGQYRTPKLAHKGTRIRLVQTIGGTSPSFTRSVNRVESNVKGIYPFRRIFDRAVSLTTLNATTATLLNVADCRNVQLSLNLGAATSPPSLQLQGTSDNGASWYNIGSPLAGVANSTVTLVVNNVAPEMLRAQVSTAGTTVTMGYVELKAF